MWIIFKCYDFIFIQTYKIDDTSIGFASFHCVFFRNCVAAQLELIFITRRYVSDIALFFILVLDFFFLVPFYQINDLFVNLT